MSGKECASSKKIERLERKIQRLRADLKALKAHVRVVDDFLKIGPHSAVYEAFLLTNK